MKHFVTSVYLDRELSKYRLIITLYKVQLMKMYCTTTSRQGMCKVWWQENEGRTVQCKMTHRVWIRVLIAGSLHNADLNWIWTVCQYYSNHGLATLVISLKMEMSVLTYVWHINLPFTISVEAMPVIFDEKHIKE